VAFSYRAEPPDPLMADRTAAELLDMLELDVSRGRPFRPEAVWELARRALIAEGAFVPETADAVSVSQGPTA